MTLLEIITHALESTNLGREGRIDSALKTRCRRDVENIYRQIWNAHPWKEIKNFQLAVTVTPTPFTVASTTGIVLLPHYVDRIRSIRQDTLPIYPVNELIVNRVDADLSEETGTSANFHYVEPWPVSAQRVSTKSIVSTDAADTTGKVFFQGEDASGFKVSETLTLTGLTPVTGSVSFTKVLQITKDKTAGQVHIGDGTETVAVISPDITSSRYRRIQLLPIPDDSALTYHLNVTRRYEPMVADQDSPVIEDVVPAIVSLLIAKLYQSRGNFQEGEIHKQEAGVALEVALNAQQEIDTNDYRVMPECGLFGIEDGNSFRDITETGIRRQY